MSHDFLLGATALGLAIAGLFFLRYWKETRDRFFATFALAFFVLSANRVLIVILGRPEAYSPVAYLIRLLAFVLILGAIIDKNLRRS